MLFVYSPMIIMKLLEYNKLYLEYQEEMDHFIYLFMLLL